MPPAKATSRPDSFKFSESYQADASISHKYRQLPLIPVDEFLAQYPDKATDDENALLFARIDHERAERETLENQRQELLKRKQKLIADNKRRKEDLANLDNDLEKFIDVSGCPSGAQRNTNEAYRRPNQFRSCSRRKASRLS